MSVEEKGKKIIMDQLSVSADEVKPEASFIEDLGADSLDLTELERIFVDEGVVTAEDLDRIRAEGSIGIFSSVEFCHLLLDGSIFNTFKKQLGLV